MGSPLNQLSGQGSNLDSSGPKPDVLPITPPDNAQDVAKLIKTLDFHSWQIKI